MTLTGLVVICLSFFVPVYLYVHQCRKKNSKVKIAAFMLFVWAPFVFFLADGIYWYAEGMSFESNWGMIRPGMIGDDVIEIIGKPDFVGHSDCVNEKLAKKTGRTPVDWYYIPKRYKAIIVLPSKGPYVTLYSHKYRESYVLWMDREDGIVLEKEYNPDR